MNKNRGRWGTAFIVFFIAVLACLIVLVFMNMQMDRQEAALAELTESVNTPSEEENDLPQEESAENLEVPVTDEESSGSLYIRRKLEVPIPEKNIDWDKLHETNPDIYAWIYVPDTNVDYPVLQHPSDDSFYLNHNLDGSSGYPGVIYTESYNSKDFTDPNTVIYGHNMDNDTMFSTLHNFRDPEMVEQDHYIFIYTPDETFAYQIFAAYEFPAVHLLLNYDLNNDKVYEQYLRNITNIADYGVRVANVRKDIRVTKYDRIVTLSTCTTDHDPNIRFLIVGVQLDTE